MTTKNADQWIAASKKLGQVARSTVHYVRTSRLEFPAALGRILQARKDGTYTAAVRAFNVGFREGVSGAW
jgi:hypothetical protein